MNVETDRSAIFTNLKLYYYKKKQYEAQRVLKIAAPLQSTVFLMSGHILILIKVSFQGLAASCRESPHAAGDCSTPVN